MIFEQNLDEACFKRGYQALQKKGIAIIGMSPGNGYFNEETIHAMLNITAPIFSQVLIMIPGKPAEHTYKAIGYPLIKAQRIARLKGNNLKNRCLRGIDELAKSSVPHSIKILDWEMDIEKNEVYQNEKRYIYELYEKNPQFFRDVREATQQVINNQPLADITLKADMDEAVHYLLEEFAFLMASSIMFNSEHITFIYHKNWPVYENFIDGVYDGSIKKIGFLILK